MGVLTAEDKELNAWVSLRKTCQYRNEEDERKDFHVYKNKSKDSNLKKKLMPSLYEVPEPEVKEETNSDKENKPSNPVSNDKAEVSEPSSKKLKVDGNTNAC